MDRGEIVSTLAEVSTRQFIATKVASAIANRRERSKRNISWVQNLVRLTLHLAGFSALTIAAFTLTFAAGMVAVGISCFLLSALKPWVIAEPENAPTLR